jgi:hypothetical protein
MQKYMAASENSGTEADIVAGRMGPVYACQNMHASTHNTID